ncbi:50S ribosomal protein L24 [Candidatus Nomurabacteria bacterium]|nr:50S ribosomal protein L24 [Candidatus Nomurabacteria bacterium]
MKVKKGDTVRIITGKDKGKEGKIIKSLPRENRVIVEGLNLMKRRRRPTKEGQKGQVVSVAAPVHASNVKKVG